MRTKSPTYNFKSLMIRRIFRRLASGSAYFTLCFSSSALRFSSWNCETCEYFAMASGPAVGVRLVGSVGELGGF